MSSKYVTIKLPKSLVEHVDKMIGKKGYTSRAEVVKEALRQLLKHEGEM